MRRVNHLNLRMARKLTLIAFFLIVGHLLLNLNAQSNPELVPGLDGSFISEDPSLFETLNDHRFDVSHKRSGEIDSIKIVCDNTEEICNLISPEEQSPFSDLNLVTKGKYTGFYNSFDSYFDVGNLSTKEIANRFFYDLKDYNSECEMIKARRLISVSGSPNKKFLVLAHHLYFYDETGDVSAGVTIIEVINGRSEVLFRKRVSGHAISRYILTDDGKYLGYMFGHHVGMHGPCSLLKEIYPQGIKVVNIKTGETVVDRKIGYNWLIDNPNHIEGKLLNWVTSSRNGKWLTYVFDSREEILFTWEYHTYEMIERNLEGFLVRDPETKAEILLEYNKDFTLIPNKL